MSFSVKLMRKLDILEPPLKDILWAILDEIEQHREDSVKKTEFNELKEIIRELGQMTQALVKTQDRTEQRLESLAQAQEEFVQAHKGVTKAIAELTQAQKQTEQEVVKLSSSLGALTQAQKQTEQEVAELSRSLKGTKSQIGGIAKSMSYALENEAYRQLPAYLKTHYQIEITEQFIRTVISGEEINLFAKAIRDNETVLVVGEAVLRLDDRAKMGQLEKNIQVVEVTLHQPILPLIVTHFAHPAVLEKAREAGVIVVQSFEWGE